MDSILEEAHSIRQEISLLHLEVESLVKHNERIGTTVHSLTIIKHDSNSITRGIHQHGEALYVRLQALGVQSCELEEKHGPNAAMSRIANTQHANLTQAFHATIAGYNQVEEAQREMWSSRFQRQASIMGKEVTEKQLDTLTENGGEGWGELSQSLQTEGQSSRWALCEIKGRQKELVELETRLREVHDLFQQMAMLGGL
ncbi:syntaxin-11-like [Salmo salar]|uniref:Syntaxin-11-like n=1 Tax=Salmo salar TaxID=8030 RepID=A0A1S3MCA6_SALSA|nr:syntaxin-11-like [Salmo salar]|eukprot:XP_014000700.1 PREDICTED: syntaxin-11-like [Salmo salar]